MSERITKYNENHYALLNHHACKIQGSIQVSIDGINSRPICNLQDKVSLKQWVIENRLPQRIFNLNLKHGENGRGNYHGESPLMCDRKEAQELLITAIGDKTERLFNLDSKHNMYIIFYSETTPISSYHGYHVDLKSVKVPNHIKKRLEIN
ncbi:MAG: hypothetical protein HQK92_07645 [Nitrospirae bacterium]|nr:hypothetical protein [Nitrospirota bacterium]